MSRVSKRTPARRAAFLDALAATRHVQVSAGMAGASVRFFYAWREDDADFAAAWDAALDAEVAPRQGESVARALERLGRRVLARGLGPEGAAASGTGGRAGGTSAADGAGDAARSVFRLGPGPEGLPAGEDSAPPDCRLFQLYPDEGPLRRELYPRHVAFLNGGGPHRQRMFMAANRVGKTEGVGGYETTLHLTGLYPHWWRGRRFDAPISAMAAGDTAKTVRDIIQKKLLGPPDRPGAGLIPLEAIVRVTRKAGVADAIDTVRVRHAAGGESTLVLRSYDQGREAFQGDEHHVIWLDEEPPMAIYTECVMRTMTTNGYVMLTFTPLNGYSEVVRQFVDDPETVWV